MLLETEIEFYTYPGKALIEWNIFMELGLTLGSSEIQERDE